MTDPDALKKLLGEVFDFQRRVELSECGSADDYERWKQLFVFHFTDWIDDVEELNGLLKNPEAFDVESACDVVHGCLIHIRPHINAAARFFLHELEFADPFADHRIDKR